jgi:hypothetical protein
MKKDYKVYIKLFAIFLFVLLILQTIRLDGFQDLNEMVDSQGIVITSPASVPMTTSQTVADPEVAAASQQAIASASAAYAELEETQQLTTRTTYVEPTFNESTRAPPVFLSRPAETPPVTAPVTPPPVTPPPVTAPVTPPVTAPVTPPVTAPVTPPVTAPVTPPVTAPVTPPVTAPITAPVIAPPVTAPVIPPATNTITQATANASALAATAAGSASTSNSQVTPLATDTTVTSTTTYILIGIIAVGGIATATVLINAK